MTKKCEHPRCWNECPRDGRYCHQHRSYYGKNTVTPSSKCLIEKCETMCPYGGKYCKRHNRGYTADREGIEYKPVTNVKPSKCSILDCETICPRGGVFCKRHSGGYSGSNYNNIRPPSECCWEDCKTICIRGGLFCKSHLSLGVELLRKQRLELIRKLSSEELFDKVAMKILRGEKVELQ